jgi:L-alanine-DL-glutamate epimerase-like enolase superfamily enzyme
VIERIETIHRGLICAVRVTTDDGAVGLGQTAPYEAGLTAHVLHELVAPAFLGRDPWDAEAIVDEVLRTGYKFPSTFILRAICGIESALWDLMGRAAGQPVYKLLGGAARDSVPMYASSMRRDISPEEEAERIAQLAEVDGFRSAKVRIGEVMGRDVDAAPGRTERIIRVMRERLPELSLRADANGGFTVSRAITVGRMLEDNGYFHFEEPCPFPEIEQTAEVARALDIAVAGGEQDTSFAQFQRMVTGRAVDILQPDVGYLGGISRTRKIAVLAETAGLPCTIHCANDSLLRVFSLHLALAMPACFQDQEWSIESRWCDDVYSGIPQVVDGRVAAPTGPGWGVDLLPEFVASAQVQESRVGR